MERTAAAAPTRNLLEPGPRRGRMRRPQSMVGWLLIAPALAILLALTVAPAAYLIYSSFFNFQLLGNTKEYVGLGNYRDLLSDPVVQNGMLRTLGFVAVVVVLEVMFGLALAVPLAARTLGNSIASTLLLLPFAITPAVSALVWRQLLDPNFGWIDYYAQKIGIMGAPVEWLSDPTNAWISIVVVDVWQWTPFVALVLMAGLQGVPKEPTEAASVDGASAWQTFRHVTLPLLVPFLTIAVLLRLVDAFKTFATIKVLTNGGPGDTTEIINLKIYRVALQDFSIGAAAALGVAFLIVLSVVVPAVIKLMTRKSHFAEQF
jgi:multiple sugar transport system permease protein